MVCDYLLAGSLITDSFLVAQPVTNETYRWVTDPRFHPSGTKIIATKWFTSGRSLGAGEGWEYSVPSLDEIQHASVKHITGSQVVGRTLPLGWTVEDYANQQIGPEQFLWHGNDSLIYSKNVVDESTFAYSKGNMPFCIYFQK